MSTLNSLLICGLQVTLVAAVGLLISSIARRWLRTSATVPLAATLAAVVLLTVCAFSSWPSWLHRESSARNSSQAGGLLGALPSRYASDPYLLEYTEVTVTTPVGLFDVPNWAFPVLFGTPRVSSSSEVAESEPTSTRWTGSHWGWAILLSGVVFGLIRVIGGLWAVRLFVRTSRPLQSPELLEQVDLLRAEMGCTPPVDIRECAHLATAATVGWRRPVVLLSESWPTWTEAQLRSVLAHEIAHITRGDFLATVAAQVGVVLHFYHPLVHWLANRLRLEQELAADALAAQVVGGSRAYLNAIGELALKQTEEPVGWPAHSFLPTRRTFLRRIEMLRDLKFLSGSAPRLVRWATLASVAAVTLVAIGLRPPGGNAPESTVQAAPPVAAVVVATEGAATQTPAASTQLEAQYVPAEASIVIAANPVILSQQFEKLKLTKLIPAETPNPLDDANVKGCKHVTVVMILPPILNNQSPDQSAGICLTFGNSEDRNAAMQAFFPPASGPDWVKTKLLLAEYEVHPPTDQARYTPDDRTLILASQRVIQSMILAGPKSLSPLTQTESWKAAVNGTVAIAVDASAVQKVMATAPPNNPFVGLFSPLWSSASSHTLSLKFADKAQLSLTSQAKDAASSQQLEGTLKAGIAMLSGMLDQAKNSPDPTTKATAEGILPVLAGHKLTTTGNLTTLTCEADLTAVAALLAPAISQARESANRQLQQNNLKQVLLAMHNYHSAYGHFPPAVVIDPQSKVARSWRVELLPYLDQSLLYEQYKKDEPWDSEANKKVLALMPAQYRHPSQGASTNTSIVAAYGKGLVFEENDTDGTQIQEILDGTSNTIAVYEAQTEIPWTKPEEPVIDLAGNKLPDLSGFAGDGLNMATADGAVRYVSKAIDRETLKKLFTKAGGEPIEGF